MAAPVQQGGSSIARFSSDSCSSASYLYAEMQCAGVKNPGTPASRIPRAPMTPRPLNQAQQRNVVRQWMGLPPIESNWQRASRQAGQAATCVVQLAGASLGQLASLAGTAWNGMRELCAESFIAGLPSLHVGPPGAAAQTPDAIPEALPTPVGSPLPERLARRASSALPLLRIEDCLDSLGAWLSLVISGQSPMGESFGTVEELLRACPTVECSANANGTLQGATIVIESTRQVSMLAMALAKRGAKVFLSAEAIAQWAVANPIGPINNCADIWFDDSYTMLGNVTPGDWTPAQNGSVVLLSSQQFAEQFENIRNVSYPSCDADAYACPPMPRPGPTPAPTPAPTPYPVPEPASGSDDVYPPSPDAVNALQPASDELFADGPALSDLSQESAAITGAYIGLGSVLPLLGGTTIFLYLKFRRKNNAAQSLTSVVVVTPPAANAAVSVPGATAALPAPVSALPSGAAQAGQTATATTGLTVATSVPAQLQNHYPTYDASHPPAGQPGGD